MDGLLRCRFEPLVCGEIPGFTRPVGLGDFGGFLVLAGRASVSRFGHQWLQLTRASVDYTGRLWPLRRVKGQVGENYNNIGRGTFASLPTSGA